LTVKKLSLPLNASERRSLLLVLDIIGLNLALFISLMIRPEYELDLKVFLYRPNWFLILTFLWIFTAGMFDGYDFSVIGDARRSVISAGKAVLLVCGVYLIIPYVTPILPSGRRYLVGFILLTLAFVTGIRAVYAAAFSTTAFKRRALILGTGWEALAIARTIRDFGKSVYEVAGFVGLGAGPPEKTDGDSVPPDERQKADRADASPKTNAFDCGEREESRVEKSQLEEFGQIVGEAKDLCALVPSSQITSLILAYPGEADGRLFDTLTECLELGVELIPMTVLYEKLTGRVPVHLAENEWFVAMPINHPGTNFLWPAVKRASDIVLSSLGLIFLSLAFPFIALAIYLDSPGPIFYRQERVGKGGRRFKAVKFRSMIPEAEKEGAVWAAKNDRRVTRVGKILRRTHIDEFPQFINILKGEMSAVGPRAERPEFVEKLRKEIPFYGARHAVRPGMAGWGLVKQGYAASKEDALVKLQYDLYYIKHQGPWLDTIILLKTFLNTVTFRGRA